MRFQRLFDVEARLGGELCPGLRIVRQVTSAQGPWPSSQPQVLVRERPSRVEVAVPIRADGTPWRPLRRDDHGLVFDVLAVDAEIMAGTELGARQGHVPTYRAARSSQRSLSPRLEPVQGGACDVNVVAVLEVNGYWGAWLQEPPSFGLVVPPRRARWAYYITTTKRALKLIDMSVGDRLVFDGPETMGASSEDPVARALVAANPSRTCLRFVTSQRIAWTRGARRLAVCLDHDAEPLLDNLPNPSCRQEALLRLTPGGPTENVWYHIIEI